jgi:Mn-dependent DtxR family transcriptional regulator
MTELEIALKAVQIYAEQHPRPHHVTKTQAAEMLGVSMPTMAKLIESGVVTMNRLGKIPIAEIDRALLPRRAS